MAFCQSAHDNHTEVMTIDENATERKDDDDDDEEEELTITKVKKKIGQSKEEQKAVTL